MALILADLVALLVTSSHSKSHELRPYIFLQVPYYGQVSGTIVVTVVTFESQKMTKFSKNSQGTRVFHTFGPDSGWPGCHSGHLRSFNVTWLKTLYLSAGPILWTGQWDHCGQSSDLWKSKNDHFLKIICGHGFLTLMAEDSSWPGCYSGHLRSFNVTWLALLVKSGHSKSHDLRSYFHLQVPYYGQTNAFSQICS